MVDILTYYDQHPINEHAVHESLLREGKNLEHLVPEDLFPYDQDHYGGLDAVDALVRCASIGAGDRVLDVCSGLGGPARYLAYRHGCSVTGIDINRSRALASRRLTRRVGLQNKVSFVCGSATNMPFMNESFTRIVSQEAFLHVGNKVALFSNCHRVLATGGCFVFTDWVASPRLSDSERTLLGEGMVAAAIHQENEYLDYLRVAEFLDVEVDNLSDWWGKILRKRLKMYLEKSEETERLFGVARYREFMDAYEIFVGVIEEGKLGGTRFTAFRADR